MPYPRTLQEYVLPEFYAEPPQSWETRLREISPVRSDMEHLVFRKFDWHPSWERCRPSEFTWERRPIWALYAARPLHLVPQETHDAYAKHWSELAETEREGRKAVVSNYQHFMWHTRGLYVEAFWILQGNGGTPAAYSKAERRILDATPGAVSQPIPLGYLPACPFDERAVQMILARDRLVKAGSLHELERQNRPEALQAEHDLAEMAYREQVLTSIRELNGPSVEFMKYYLKKSEASMTLPDAPEGLANTIAQWKEKFRETGQMIGVSNPATRTLQVAVS